MSNDVARRARRLASLTKTKLQRAARSSTDVVHPDRLGVIRRRLDETREQLRTARAQRDEARTALATAREQVVEARRQRDEERRRVLEARESRESIIGERTDLRLQRDDLRQQVADLVSPEAAAVRLHAEIRPRLSWAATDGDRAPVVDLAYGPTGAPNPVLPLMYSRCPELGYRPLPMRRLDGPFPLAPGSWFHLHWTRFLQVTHTREGRLGRTVDAARASTLAFASMLRDMKEAGVHVAWTVHEALPHDCPYPDLEVELRKELVDIATMIHVLHDCTADEVGDQYALDPDKTRVVEHPLYTGVYPDYMTRASARRLLDIGDDDIVLLVFGNIRPYKGIDRLLAWVADAHRRGVADRVRVVITGPAHQTVEVSQLVLRAQSTPGVSILPTLVHPSHAQLYFRAADVTVLPYNDFLNSGVLMLSLTFGVPVLAPENGVTREAMESGLVQLFDRTSDESLGEALERIVTCPASIPAGPLAATFAARMAPQAVAGRLAEAYGEFDGRR